VETPSDIALLVRGSELSLRAANKSPKTIKSYTDTSEGFVCSSLTTGCRQTSGI